MTVDEKDESKKAAENTSKSSEGEGVAKATEIINLENGNDDSEKKSDLDSSKEVQKNGDGGPKDDEEVMIIGEQTPVKVVKVPTNPLKTVSARDEMLIKKMLELLKKYGCEFCNRRFDTKFALSHHERSHLKEHQKKVEQDPDFVRKKLKLNADGTPREKVHKNTKMGSVQEHTNEAGPECFKCGQVCKDNSNLRNHVLSHYYRIFDPLIPQVKPFPCPECDKPSRDKITMIRHFAFTHGKLFELTEVTPAHLITAGGTPRKKREKKVEEGGEQGETEEKKSEEEKTETETNGTDVTANEDKEEEAEKEEKMEENGEEKSSTAPAERNATPAPIIEKAEEVRQISEVDDCKAPIIDNSSSESEEEEGGAVKVRLDKDSTRFLYAWLNSRLEHPFPSSEQTAALASESGLTVKQVETWFRKKRKAMGVPEIEKKEEKKKETPKKKGKKKGKKKSESEEEEEEDEGADYVVESVLERKVVTGKRGKSHKTLYLVKWLGWDREEDLTWEPLEHLQDPDGTCQALEIFEKKEKEKERLAKEKADMEETMMATSTGDEGRQGDASDPICLSSS